MAQLFCNFVSYSLGYGVDISITLPTLSSCDLGPDAKPCHTPGPPTRCSICSTATATTTNAGCGTPRWSGTPRSAASPW